MPSQMKKILAILSLTFIAAIGLFSLGIAYTGGVRVIGLLGVWFFLTFGIVIVLAQLIPAGILLSSFIGAATSPRRKSEVPVAVA